MKFSYSEEIRDLTDRINKQYERLKQENAELRETLRTWNAESGIEALEKELRETRRRALKNMSEKEAAAAADFRLRHWQEHSMKSSKTVGNTYIYTLTGTGIGTVIKIKCPICGEEEDITDVDSW